MYQYGCFGILYLGPIIQNVGPNENYIVPQSHLQGSLAEAGTQSELVENHRTACTQVLFLGFFTFNK